MDREFRRSLRRAARFALHSQPGRDPISAVGATAIGAAAPLLATPAAPLVVGAVAIAAACLGANELLKRLNS